MISYEQAKAKALKAKSTVNAALEYKGAYVFYNSNGKNEMNGEVVILKSNGNVVTMSDYVISSRDNGRPKKLAF